MLLVLASERDCLVDAECSRRIAAALRLPLGRHPTAGHDFPLDDPDWVVQGIAQAWPTAAAP